MPQGKSLDRDKEVCTWSMANVRMDPPNPREQQFPSAMFPPVQVSPPTTQKAVSQSTVDPTGSQGEFKAQLVQPMCDQEAPNLGPEDRETCLSI